MKELESVLSRSLGLVKSDVGITEEIPASRPIAHCDPDARTGMEWGGVAVEFEWLLHHRQQSFRHKFRQDMRIAAVDQDDELVAPHAADRVGSPECARQALATAFNNWSPASWPRESLTFLKSSRSM